MVGTLGGVVGATGRGVGHTINTTSRTEMVGNGVSAITNGVEKGVCEIAKGVEKGSKGEKLW